MTSLAFVYIIVSKNTVYYCYFSAAIQKQKDFLAQQALFELESHLLLLNRRVQKKSIVLFEKIPGNITKCYIGYDVIQSTNSEELNRLCCPPVTPSIDLEKV